MHAIIPFLLRHGYWVLFVNIAAEQIGLPVPAVPVLLAMGALAGLGNFSIWSALALAVFACLTSDLIWFRLGRTRGHSILNLLCRVSLEPDSCVSNTKSWFGRWGAKSFLVSKFIPGLNTAAAPMAGLTRMPLVKFLGADAAGSAMYAAAYLAVGYVFRNQLEAAGEQAGRMGSGLLLVILSLLAGYIGWKYYQRRLFIRELRVARVSPEDLRSMLDKGDDVAVVDLRRALEVQHDRVKLPGAIWIDMGEFEDRHPEIPRDKDIILYCS